MKETLLHRDGVLRFVMDGERIHNVLPPFDRSQLLQPLEQQAQAQLQAQAQVQAQTQVLASAPAKIAPAAPPAPVALTHTDSASDTGAAKIAGSNSVASGSDSGSSKVVSQVDIINHHTNVKKASTRLLALWELAALVVLVLFVAAAAYGMVACLEAVGVIEHQPGISGAGTIGSTPSRSGGTGTGTGTSNKDGAKKKHKAKSIV